MSRYSLIFDTDFQSFAASLGASLDSIPSNCRLSRYNIGRDQNIVVLQASPDTATSNQAKPEQSIVATTMRWGFTPHWIHSPNPALQPLTVADTKTLQPYFRDAFRQRRCLIPASGFYAWQGWENGPAAPYYVRMRGRQPFLMAAIWDTCEGIDRVAMITVAANSLIHPIHDRMPAIIGVDQVEEWLRGDGPQHLLAPYPATAMETYQVGRKVFSLINDGTDLISPVVPPLLAVAHA